MVDLSVPRVWVGSDGRYTEPYWWWMGCRAWLLARHHPRQGEVFIAGSQPKPTIDPYTMSELKTCKEVDW